MRFGGGESLEAVEIYAYVGNKGVGMMESPLDVVCLGKKRGKKNVQTGSTD